jgi:hypothetical protein
MSNILAFSFYSEYWLFFLMVNVSLSSSKWDYFCKVSSVPYRIASLAGLGAYCYLGSMYQQIGPITVSSMMTAVALNRCSTTCMTRVLRPCNIFPAS